MLRLARLLLQTMRLASKIEMPFWKKCWMLIDYLSLYRTKGITADEYYSFEFERRDALFRDSFMGLNEQRFYLDYLNPIKYYSFARNKYITHKILDHTGIRTTELLCYYHPEATYNDSDECACCLNDVLRILTEKKVDSFVIKATEASHGHDVCVVKSISYQDTDATLVGFNGQVFALSEVLGEEPLIFESLIVQSKQFSDFNSSSVNTVRFMTTLWPDGTARVIACFMKVGRSGNCFDNAGDGGNVDACVDVETGEIKYAVQFDGWRRVKEINVHPDSGIQLNGVIIRNWETIKSEVIKFQQAFPFCKAAGWDIAFTEDGPVVVEVNDFWDRTGQLFIRRGWRNEIKDCYLAWKRTGKSYDMCRQPNALRSSHLKKIVSHE